MTPSLGLLLTVVATVQDPAARVDALMAPWAETPGAAIVVVHQGRVVHSKGYGYADVARRVPITPETRFLLGSVTKQFTAMAIMMLADEGKLRYDDPLTKFFPQFPEYARGITVRQLLHHTAGFPEYDDLFVETGLIDKNWPRSASTPPSPKEPTVQDALRVLSAVAAPKFPAGSKWEYSNSGYVLLALIAERASGQRFAELLATRIFGPLGMGQSLLYDERKPAVPMKAVSYRRDGTGFQDIDYAPQNAVYGEDNVYSTLGDMVKWDQALDSERLVKAATLAMAFTPGSLTNGTATRYGFGWQIDQFLGKRRISHGGSWLGFRTAIVRIPSERFSVVVLANLADIESEALAGQVAKIYLGTKLTLPTTIRLSADQLEAWAGSYQVTPEIAVNVVATGEGLEARLPWGPVWRLLPTAANDFVIADQEWRKVTFRHDEQGTRFEIDGFVGRRAKPR